jgi:steroid delta-isomerase
LASETDIRATIDRYQATFPSDREGWLALFADDATVEDPVGSPPRRGRAEIGSFWDEIHAMITSIETTVIQRPAVCDHEAAFAFEARITIGEGAVLIPIIDVMTFDDHGRIRSMRAFVDQAQPVASTP